MTSATSPPLLYERFTEQGTLSEPQGVPDPRFALQGTVNWMRALAILVADEGIRAASMAARYTSVAKAKLSDQAINTIFEQLLMSLHHLAALQAMDSHGNRVDLARSAIVTWYYGIYHAASAMVAAQVGTHQDTHADAANVWDRQIAERGLAAAPFGYRVTSLVKIVAETEIEVLRAGNSHDLNTHPTNADEALGACLSYLKGSVAWKRWGVEQDLLSGELKKLGLSNFLTKRARALRDSKIAGRSFGFVHQAFRYRGKANYREALFISYGQHVDASLREFYGDLATVLTAFLCMAGVFCGRRVGRTLWNDFLADLTANCPLSVKHYPLWTAAGSVP